MITLEKARQIISNVPEDKAFWLADGHKLMNLKELRNALTTIPPDVFNHHVNDQRNDFANWTRDVVRDPDLSDDLRKTRTQHLTLLKVNARIRELESIVQPKVTRVSISPVRVTIRHHAAKKKTSKTKKHSRKSSSKKKRR